MKLVLTFDEKYSSIGKGSPYDGIFITGVITTGIFCRPTCRAKKPKSKNVIFYDNSEQAINNGFRPCKICKHMEVEGKTPDNIKAIILELQNNPYLKIKDEDLIQRKIEPSKIRRWFKDNHGITFHAYQRMLRINKAYNQIKGGNSVTNTAFGLGYESLSGFNESWKQIFGEAPQKTDKIVINIIRFTTKLGPMFACATDKGICLLEFTDRKKLDIQFKKLCDKLNAVILPGINHHLELAQTQVAEYLDGKRKEFDIPIDAPGTDFQELVWEILQKIPYGKTWSYKQQAIKLGKPKSVRAVASANGSNRVALIIPCHRVIGSNGHLTGYAGGIKRKKWLLDLESS